MKSILVATGGTMAWSDRDQAMLSGAELGERAGLDLDQVVDVSSAPSWDLSLPDMQRTAQAVTTAIVDGAEAVVVAHGTDTLEDAAWLTELLLDAPLRRAAGVVFTGAMRFSDADGSDGPDNLRQALALAEEGAGRDRGVQVAFAGRVHAARWARKVDAWAPDCFDSGRRPPSAPAPPAGAARLNLDVALVKVGPLSPAPLPHATGLVLEGTGADHVPSGYHAEIEARIQEDRPVVVASRCTDSRPGPPPPTGALRARDLTAEKATLALMVGLGVHEDMTGIRPWWDELLGGGRTDGP